MKNFSVLHKNFSLKYANKVKGKNKLSVISFFSGAGGASLGYKWAGYNVVAANEFVKSAANIYRDNHKETVLYECDIRTLSPKQLLKDLKIKKGELDLMDASPPCEFFSANTAFIQEDRIGKTVEYKPGYHQRIDDLFDYTIDMLKGLKPKTFVFENVAGMVKTDYSKQKLNNYLGLMRNAGYVVKYAILDGSLLGIPQKRERVIIVGVRKDLGVAPCFPKPLKPMYIKDVFPNIAYYFVRDCHSNVITKKPANTTSFRTILSSAATKKLNINNVRNPYHVEEVSGINRNITLMEAQISTGYPADYKFNCSYAIAWEKIGASHAPVQVYHIASKIRDTILLPYYKKQEGSKN